MVKRERNEKMKEKEKSAKSIIVGIGFCLTFAIAILFCVCVYFNQTRNISLNIDELETQEIENAELAITSVTQNEKYLKIEGNYMTNLENYELYIGLNARWRTKNL